MINRRKFLTSGVVLLSALVLPVIKTSTKTEDIEEPSLVVVKINGEVIEHHAVKEVRDESSFHLEVIVSNEEWYRLFQRRHYNYTSNYNSDFESLIPEADYIEVFQGDKLINSYVCRYGGFDYQVEDEYQYVVLFYVINGLLKCPWVE